MTTPVPHLVPQPVPPRVPHRVPDRVDLEAYDHAVTRFREQGIALPTFAQLATPSPAAAAALASAGVDSSAADPRNLWRVHWHNHTTAARPTFAEVPDHLVVPPSL